MSYQIYQITVDDQPLKAFSKPATYHRAKAWCKKMNSGVISENYRFVVLIAGLDGRQPIVKNGVITYI